MLTKEYILECLDKHCDFDMLTEGNFYDSVVEPLKEQECFENYQWTWNTGASKGVLIFKDLDFVVKIPFMGEDDFYESHYENSNGSWIWEEDSQWNSNLKRVDSFNDFHEFSGACSELTEEGSWDYCEVEADLAVEAKAWGLEKCFAETKFLGRAKDHPIYTQERCCMFDEAFSSTNKEKYSKRTQSDYDSLREVREKIKFWGIDNNWVLDFLIYWGEEILKRLGEFIDKFDIEDLHCGNIGYRNGAPCLVDYSSYHG